MPRRIALTIAPALTAFVVITVAALILTLRSSEANAQNTQDIMYLESDVRQLDEHFGKSTVAAANVEPSQT
ncbi:MAG: hypothetical protein O3A33_04415 [Chloroflexi bacterium]|nr:hypothetical protein [Chloroflexota bacterium]